MTEPVSDPRSLEHPDTAMAFRDLMTTIIQKEVTHLTPNTMYGTILNVKKQGPVFDFGVVTGGTIDIVESSVNPEGPPPEGPDNPYQLYYATVRLDNGEIVTARLHENIPFCRPATYYDPDNPAGTVGSVLIAQGVYRYAVEEAVIDDSGIVSNRIVPDMTQHMPSLPKVPPRVMVSGTIGKYYVARIMRGMVEFDSPVLVNSYQNGINKVAWKGDEFEVFECEKTYMEQGWVGDCAFYSQTGYEIEVQYGYQIEMTQKYRLTKYDTFGMDAGEWITVVPYQDSWADLNAGSTADLKKNILRASVAASGAMFFYVQNRDADTTLSVATDRHEWAGHVTIRSLDSQLLEIRGSSAVLPTGYDVFSWKTNTSTLWTNQPVSDYSAYHNPYDVETVHYLKAQNNLTGGGIVSLDLYTSTKRLSWTQRFIPMSGRGLYRQQAYTDITMPPVGTVIPWAGKYGVSGIQQLGRAVTAEGIDVTGWVGLYYVLTTGANQAVNPGNFVMVDYLGYTNVPPNWLLIFQSNNDSQGAYGRLGTGREIDYWRTPTLATGWGFNAIPCRYKCENGYVTFKGGFNNTTAATSANPASIANFVPVGFRPDATRLFGVNLLTSAGAVGTASARVDVTTTGTLTLRGPVLASGQVMMDSVAYHAEA